MLAVYISQRKYQTLYVCLCIRCLLFLPDYNPSSGCVGKLFLE
jgi:hypothetical protein